MYDAMYLIGGITFFLGKIALLIMLLIAAFIVYPGIVTIAVIAGFIIGGYWGFKQCKNEGLL